MKRSSPRGFVCLLAFAFALFVNCGSPPPKPAKTTRTVALITNTSSDYWKIVRKGCEKADAELNDVTVAFKTTYGGTVEEQNRLIRQALDRDDADAIAISPIDPAKQIKPINDAAKRALVITQDSDAPGSERVLYIGADNRAAGRQAGELIKKALPQGGRIMVFVGKRELQNAQERFEGLKESLQGSRIEIIDLMTDDNDPVRARDNAVETLKKYPDIAGMIGLYSYNGPTILSAVKSENKVGKIKIVCFDDERETLDGIKEGGIFATVAQQPFEYGYQSVQTAAKILKGDRSMIPENKTIFIPTVVIQRDNVDEFKSKLDQMLAGAPAS
ncbi:MAG TPA: sugar-binding protein [Pyrinomonadaceae bacterium]|nr:sugar-binding protein [Pyrinomonadaceae bacterium]